MARKKMDAKIARDSSYESPPPSRILISDIEQVVRHLGQDIHDRYMSDVTILPDPRGSIFRRQIYQYREKYLDDYTCNRYRALVCRGYL